MNKITNTLHNYFEITKIAADGTETKYMAYNVVTSRGLSNVTTGLPAASTAIKLTSYISVGEGNGTPSVDNTQLFAPLANYATTLEAVGKSGESTFWGRHKVQLDPGVLVGKTITEVGFASSSSTSGGVNTHAMIKDSQGQTVGIYKTATDKIIIRATIYLTVVSSEGMWHSLGNYAYIKGQPSSSDDLPTEVAQVVAGYSSALGMSHAAGTHKFLVNDAYATHFTSSDGATISADFGNAAVPDQPYTRKIRHSMGVNQGNDYRIYGYMYKYYKSSIGIPIQSLGFNGIEYTNVSLGQGDASTTIFDIPPLYQNHKQLVVKVNGVETQDYEVIKGWGIDSMYNAAGFLHCHFYPKPDSPAEYYRATRLHNSAYGYDSSYSGTGYNILSKVRWDDEKDMFIFEGEDASYVAHTYSSGSTILAKSKTLFSYITEEGWWTHENTNTCLREFDPATGVVGNIKFEIPTSNTQQALKIEGTDIYTTGTKLGRIVDGVWTGIGSMPNSDAKIIWSNTSRDSFGYLGRLIISGEWGATSNKLYKWSDELSNYQQISTSAVDLIGLINYNKGIGFNTSTKQLTEYTFSEDFSVTSSRVLMDKIIDAACIWLPQEQEGIIVCVPSSNTKSGIVLSLDSSSAEYLSITAMGLPRIDGYSGNSNLTLNVAGEYAGTVACRHPREGYLANRKHIMKIPCRIKFKTPPAAGDSITIDVVNKYLYKNSDLTINADWYMSCQ